MNRNLLILFGVLAVALVVIYANSSTDSETAIGSTTGGGINTRLRSSIFSASMSDPDTTVPAVDSNGDFKMSSKTAKIDAVNTNLSGNLTVDGTANTSTVNIGTVGSIRQKDGYIELISSPAGAGVAFTAPVVGVRRKLLVENPSDSQAMINVGDALDFLLKNAVIKGQQIRIQNQNTQKNMVDTSSGGSSGAVYVEGDRNRVGSSLVWKIIDADCGGRYTNVLSDSRCV
jgi:hypothetical protein